jgi:hypothetical protein
MKMPVLTLIAGLVLLASCGTVTPTPDPDPFVPTKPQAKYERSLGLDLSGAKPTMNLNQSYTMSLTTSCSLQDLSDGKDLIYLLDPKIGTANLYSTATDGTNRKLLATAGFTNGKAALTFTPTEAGKAKLDFELEIDGAKYTPDSGTAVVTALENKCKTLIAADSKFATISGQYEILGIFNGSTRTLSRLSVTFQ